MKGDQLKEKVHDLLDALDDADPAAIYDQACVIEENTATDLNLRSALAQFLYEYQRNREGGLDPR